MSIRRLKTLIAIAEKGTFAAAAETVFVSHAAVSQQMKALEDDFQVALFDRTKRSPELNPLGQALVRRAREVVHTYDNMVQSIIGEEGLMGELSIGVLPTTITGLVPQAIRIMKNSYPRLHIRVTPGLSADVLPQVDRGGLDAAIISEPPFLPKHMNWRPFAEEPLILLAPANETSDDPEFLLKNRPYIRFNRRAWVGQMIEQWLQERKLTVSESMELDTLEAISSMVYNELGVSIVPKRCVPSPHPLPVKRIPLDKATGETARPRLLGLASRTDTTKFKFIDVLYAELVALVEAAGEVKAIHA